MAKQKLTRREFLLMAGLAAVAPTLVACAQKAAPSSGEPSAEEPGGAAQPAPAGAVEIEWWPGWPGPYMLAIGKLFEDKYPDVKLKIVSNYPEKEAVLSAVASGMPPDIIADIPYLELIARGVVLPLDDMIEASSEISVTDGDILEELWEVFAWEGKHYGIPSVDTAGREGMGFNLDMVEAAGLDPNNLPTTWEGVFDWHQQITKLDDAGNLQILGMAPMAERTDACSDGDPWMWPHMWGFAYVKDLVYDIDRTETIDFLNVIKKFSDSVGVEKVQGLASSLEGISRGPFGVGKQAMQITYPSGPKGVWQTNPTQKYKFTWVPVPASRDGTKVQTAGGHAGIIMKDSKHPELAFNLAVFLTQKEACDILFDQVGWIGPRKSWQEQVDMSKYPEHVQESIQFFTSSLANADECWYNTDPIEGITAEQWVNAFEGVMYGDITPEEAAKKMQDTLTEELAAALENRG